MSTRMHWFVLTAAAGFLLAGCHSDIPSAADAERAGRKMSAATPVQPPAAPAAAPAAASSPPAILPPAGALPERPWIHTADASASRQLAEGWHGIESGGWRWMAREAHATVRLPAQPQQVEVRLFLPEGHLAKIGGAVRFLVLLDGRAVAQETYGRHGAHVLRKELPRNLAGGRSVKMTLRVDRTAPPSDADRRELGAVIEAFGVR